jgi:hypothetical protein
MANLMEIYTNLIGPIPAGLEPFVYMACVMTTMLTFFCIVLAIAYVMGYMSH